MSDVKAEYGSSAAVTITLASLASSATLTAGRESTAVDNTTNKFSDYWVTGKVTTGTSPTTGKTIEIWAYGSENDSHDYPDVFDGTDSAETATSAEVKGSSLKLAHVIGTNATSDETYPFSFTVRRLFGDVTPKKFGFFVTHDTGVALNSTGSNHRIEVTGIYETVS